MPWRLLTERATLPILGGPLAGRRWMAASRRSFLLGTYETEQVEAFGAHLKPGDVVYDVGAHWGYFALMASLRVGQEGRVVAFEPCAYNLVRLRRIVEANRLTNVTILGLAAGDQEGTARFETRGGSRTPRLSEDGLVEVRIATLDGLIQRGETPPPQVMKVDVEGAEVGLLQGAQELIREYSPVIFLSTHHFAGTKEPCREVLREYGYVMEPLNAPDYESGTDFLARRA